MTYTQKNRPARGLTRRASLLLPLALGGCSWIGDLFESNDDKKPIEGNRLAVLAPERGLAVDHMAENQIVTVPQITRNATWPQPGGNPAHAMGHLWAGPLKRVWRTSIGTGGGYRRQLTAQPLVANGRAFTMDSDAVVSAFSLQDGSQIWQTETKQEDVESSNVGGGIAYDDGRLYVVTGRADVLALDPANGKIIWRNSLAMPARSAPTVVSGLLFVGTIDDQLLAINLKDGSQVWSYQATNTPIAVLGQPAPAYSDGVVVAGFGSGDLAALRGVSGSPVWTDNLGSVRGGNMLADFASISAMPVIDGGTVYAVGLGGLLVAIDLRSGRRLWERGVAGGQAPWVAGDWLFMVSADQRLVAMTKADGLVRWVTQLPRWRNEEKQKEPVFWSGPLLAGGKLILTSDAESGQLLAVAPEDGKILSQTDLSAPASLPPIAAAGLVLVLANDATLTAYR
jgi:outer membrane protein assembly factor BamB